MSLTQRLAELNITLPPVTAPVAAYIPALVQGPVVRTSGQLPFRNGTLVSEGRCGSLTVNLATAQDAARQAALNALAAAAEVAGGVDQIARVIKITGYVSSTENFFAQPKVIDGASQFYREIFGSLHIRSAVGVAALPLNATVEIEVEFELI